MTILVSVCLFWLGRPSRGADPAASLRATQTAGNVIPTPPALGADNACRTCHRLDQGFSHPVDVAPSAAMRVPDTLPLSADGKITCTTCHDAGGAHGHNRQISRNRREYLLRTALNDGPGRGCAVCHQQTPALPRKGKPSHTLAVDRAHYIKAAVPTARSVIYASIQGSTDLDAESRSCLSCHDGTIARDIGRDAHQGHSVGIAYGNSSADREMPVRPANTLDSRILLFDGRIGCNSCHNPYSTEKSRLVMSNYGSRLCLSCHSG